MTQREQGEADGLDRFDVTSGPVLSLAMGTLKIPGLYVGKLVEETYRPPPPKATPLYLFMREKRTVRQILRAQAPRRQTRREPDPICPISGADHYWRGHGMDAYSKEQRQQCKECKVTRIKPAGWVKPERSKKA